MRVGVVGASGYSGIEIVRHLLRHPRVALAYLASDASAGRDLDDLYPHLRGLCSCALEPYSADSAAAAADVALVALPAGRSGQAAAELIERGLRVIDLSGDYRLPADVYERWYGRAAPPNPAVPPVYGLPEASAQSVRDARLVANPGCYPTAALLALLPAVKAGLVARDGIVIDAKSGVSGAGRSASLDTHFSEVNENCRPYKVGVHQHTPEIEAVLGAAAGSPVVVSFTPHLIPMTRGILATAYAQLAPGVDEADVRGAYETFYRGKPFVRLLPAGAWPQTKAVLGSNYCDLALHVDERTRRLVALAALDNLVKGAAGQAVQNLNLMAGWPEDEGLRQVPLYP